MKAYFDFVFRVRQFPFNPGYLTSVSAPKSRDIKISPFKTNSAYKRVRLRQVFTVVALALCLFLIVTNVWADPSGLAV